MVSFTQTLLFTGYMIVTYGQRLVSRELSSNCRKIQCAKTDCSNPFIRPGQCCSECPSSPNCATVVCPVPSCSNPITPPGQCCPVCQGSKPGRCPRPTGYSTCLTSCTDDFSCRGRLKCCGSWCGRTCQLPTGEDKCDGVVCPLLPCANQYTPIEQCCPECRQTEKLECSDVFCTQKYCVDQFIPPGKCCPVCPLDMH